MKLTLTYVGRFTTKKDGTPLISSKTGRPYTSLRIKANEYGDKYISGFDSAETKGWKEGDTVEADVEQKGEYLNFSVPKKTEGGMSDAQFQTLIREIRAVNANVLRVIGLVDTTTSDGNPVPNFDVGEPSEEQGW